MFEAMMVRVRACFARLPDHRQPSNNTNYRISDAALSALSVFVMQSPWFLAHQREMERKRVRNNVQSLFGAYEIPCDNQIRLAPGSVTILADDLHSKQPTCEACLAHDFNFLFVCRPDSHPTLYQEIDLPERIAAVPSLAVRRWNGRCHERTTYRYLNDLPLRAGEDALLVNWCEVVVADEQRRELLYRNAFITNHAITAENIVDKPFNYTYREHLVTGNVLSHKVSPRSLIRYTRYKEISTVLQKNIWFMILIFLLSITACTPVVIEPGAAPDEDTAEQVATEAIPAARLALASHLGVPSDSVELEQIEDAEWLDSCLGLGGPAESCAAGSTPGYTITFTVDGESYAVRTDLDGGEVRVETAAEEPGAGAPPPAVAAAQAELAQQLGIEPGAIEVLSYEEMEWSDSCLGLGGPAESCATVITPGWQVMLGPEGGPADEVYAVRTDATGQQVRVADESAGDPATGIPDPELNGAVVFFERSGGLTGELMTVRIYPDGTVERAMGEPSPDMPVETAVIDQATLEELVAGLEEAGYFDLERTHLPEDLCCDRYLYLVSVQGEEAVQTVEALEATPDTPDALWKSVELIEGVIAGAFEE